MHAELFVEFGADRVLSTFAGSRRERDGVHSVFAAENGQAAAILVVRMSGNAHHRPWICEVEQRLMQLGIVGLRPQLAYLNSNSAIKLINVIRVILWKNPHLFFEAFPLSPYSTK